MANWYDPTPEILKEIEDWLKDRPAIIKDLARRFPPYRLHKLKTSDQRVWVISMNENGTMTVAVSKWFNRVGMERQVFGIKPEDLEECDLPEEGEVVGCGNVSIEEAKAIFDKRMTYEQVMAQGKHVEFMRFNKAKAVAEILGGADEAV